MAKHLACCFWLVDHQFVICTDPLQKDEINRKAFEKFKKEHSSVPPTIDNALPSERFDGECIALSRQVLCHSLYPDWKMIPLLCHWFVKLYIGSREIVEATCEWLVILCNGVTHWAAVCRLLASGSDGNAAAWTTEEQKLLEQALKTYPVSTPERWEKIAAAVPGRSKKDCMKRYKVRRYPHLGVY